MSVKTAPRRARACIGKVVLDGVMHIQKSPFSFWCLAILTYIALPLASATSEPSMATPRCTGPSVSAAVFGVLAGGLLASGRGSGVRGPGLGSEAWCKQHNVVISSTIDGVLYTCTSCTPGVPFTSLRSVKRHFKTKHSGAFDAVEGPSMPPLAHTLSPHTDMTSQDHRELVESPPLQGPLVYLNEEEADVTWDDGPWFDACDDHHDNQRCDGFDLPPDIEIDVANHYEDNIENTDDEAPHGGPLHDPEVVEHDYLSDDGDEVKGDESGDHQNCEMLHHDSSSASEAEEPTPNMGAKRQRLRKSVSTRKTAQYYINRRLDLIHPNAKITVLASAFLMCDMKDKCNIHDAAFDQHCRFIRDVLLPGGNDFPPSHHLMKSVVGYKPPDEYEHRLHT